MKHSVKRILALVLMFVMIAALGTTAMATTPSPVTTPIGGTVPAETDTATVQIKGFSNENVTVKAYQIVKANYFKPSDPQQGFAGYEVVEDAGKDFMEEIKDSNGVVQTDESGNPKYRIIYPTSNDISRLAQSISALGLTAIDGFTLTPEEETYTATKALGAGEYMVIAEDKDGTTVYNPMLVSVYYVDNGGQLAIDPISINDYWDGGLAVQNAYVKSTTPDMEKKIENPGATDSGNHGDDAAVGSVVDFKVDKIVIPSYSDEYFFYSKATQSTSGNETVTTTELVERTTEKAVVFNLKDELDPGLTLKGDIVVKIGGTEFAKITNVTANASESGKYTYTYTAASGEKGESFVIALDKAYLKTLAGLGAEKRAVEVTYKATVNDKVTMNFDPTKNTFTVEYTNKTTPDSDDASETKELEDVTYHYTFALDAKINGVSTQYNKITHEVIKINEKGERVEEKKFTETGEEYKVPKAVQGAVFELVSKTDSSVKYYAVTDANGYFVDYATYKANGGPEKSEFKSGSTTVASSKIGGFRQLDAGEYTMKEVVAPEGFTIDTTEYAVKITAAYYDEDQFDNNNKLLAKKGQLKSYKVEVAGNTSEYLATYDDKQVKEVAGLDGGTTVTTTYIKEARIPKLPSTGGIGTYVFTVAGVAILTVAAVLVIRGKRKES